MASLLVYVMVTMVALLALVRAAVIVLRNLNHLLMKTTASGIKKHALRKVDLG
jgi:hypothetical protein